MTASATNKRTFFMLGLFLLIGTGLAFLASSAGGLWRLDLFRSGPYMILISAALFFAAVLLFVKRFFQKMVPLGALKLVFGIIFLPILLLPVFRCYFKVPFVFCRACPNRCAWGMVRPFVLSSAVLLNISGRFWCVGLCPFGTFQECQARVSPKRFSLFSFLAVLLYVILFLVTGMYLLTLFDLPWADAFEIGRYAWGTAAVLVMVLILSGAFFVPRFWCRYFCPIGAVAELTAVFQKKRP